MDGHTLEQRKHIRNHKVRERLAYQWKYILEQRKRNEQHQSQNGENAIGLRA